MRGVILAGGAGTRLHPMTKGVNKHLLPIGGQPMLAYPLRKFTEWGVRDVLLVAGPEHMSQFAHVFGDGSEWGCRLTYRIQQRPGGIAEALRLAEPFVDTGPFCVLLGDNLFGSPLSELNSYLPIQEGEAVVVVKEVPDPERFGIAQLDGNRIVDIVEKPKRPVSNLCVTGIYVYTSSVFQIIRDLKPSARGELEISDVNRCYAQLGRLKHHRLTSWWIDAGTIESLAEAQRYIQGT